MADYDSLEILKARIYNDPEGYKDELYLQIKRFDAIFEMIEIQKNLEVSNEIHLPSDFPPLLNFLVNIAPKFKPDLKNLPSQLISLASKNLKFADHSTQLLIVKAIASLHKNELIATPDAFRKLFPLMEIANKDIRAVISRHLLTSVVRRNQKTKNNALNAFVVRFLNGFIQNSRSFNKNSIKNSVKKSKIGEIRVENGENEFSTNSAVLAVKSVSILGELYRKGIFRTAKVANLIAEAVFSERSQVMTKAAHFLLGQNLTDDKNEEEELNFQKKSENLKIKLEIEKGIKNVKRTKKMQRLLKRVKKRIEKKPSKNYEEISEPNPNSEKMQKLDFSAIRSLHDPQAFAERVLRLARGCRAGFKAKLLLFQLLSRVIGCHELLIVNFYSLLQRYMQPHQTAVTKILVYFVQATHSKIPAEILQPVIRLLANNFVNDRSNSQVITVALNTIREIAARNQEAIEEYILHDLIRFKNAKEKSVAVAARGLLTFYRLENPKMLPKNERGCKLNIRKKDEKINENSSENVKNDQLENNKNENNKKEEKNLINNVKNEKEKLDFTLKLPSDISDDENSDHNFTPEFPVEVDDLLGNIIIKKRKIEEAKNLKKEKRKFERTKKGGGTTNEDKKRKKNFKLTKHSAVVLNRKKRSLRAKQKVAVLHTKRMKLGKRRKYQKKSR